MSKIVIVLSMVLALGFSPQLGASTLDRGNLPANTGQGLGCCI